MIRRRGRFWPAAAALLAWGPAQAQPTTAPTQAEAAGTVQVAAGGREITTRGAPLSLVLEELGRHVGLDVVYEGGEAPAAPLTLRVRASTPADALREVLDRSAAAYMLRLDTTGERPRTVYIFTARRPPVLAAEAAAPAAEAASRVGKGGERVATVRPPAPGEPADPSADAVPPAEAVPPASGPRLVPFEPRSMLPTSPAYTPSPFAPQPPILFYVPVAAAATPQG